MDVSKKVKTGESSTQLTADVPDDVVAPAPALSVQDVRKILEPLSMEQLVDVLQTVVIRDESVLAAVRSATDSDHTYRKLFVSGVGSETTTEKLRSLFSWFGELEDAVVVTDKASGKSKGYGFVTFRHIDGAVLALKEPSKKIDGRMTVVQLAADRDSDRFDVWTRKVLVKNVSFEISPERLLDYFSVFGDIEEGPLGFDKQPGKEKGFAIFIYKSEEEAQRCLVNPDKNIDGHQVNCKLATDGRRRNVGGFHGQIGTHGDVFPPRRSMNMDYGGPTLFGGFPCGPLQFHQHPRLSSSIPLSYGGGPRLGNQGSAFFGSGGGYAAVGYPDVGGSSRDFNNYGAPSRIDVYPGVGSYGVPSAFQVSLPPAGPRDHLGGRFDNWPPFY